MSEDLLGCLRIDEWHWHPAANGFARVQCTDCHEEYLLAFSCKTRELYPSCAARRAAATAVLLREEVLQEVGHVQWVFVMPQMLRPYFLHHRELLGGLARAAWETVRELMVAATGEDSLRPGMVAVVQTAGDLANWHPHVHALVSRGGWTSDWEWVPVAYVDEHAAELLFRHKVMRMLQDVGLLTEERTELLLSWRHSGFSVHNRVRVEPEDQSAVERLARYIMRPPISLERMRWEVGGEVRYRRKAGHDGGPGQHGDPEEVFDPAEFLARVIMHIPEPRRHLVRYYGAYSNVSRGKRRRQDDADIGAAPPDGRHSPRLRPPGTTAPTPALFAEVGRSSSSVSLRWTRWCARSAKARCGSSPSSSTTRSSTRS